MIHRSTGSMACHALHWGFCAHNLRHTTPYRLFAPDDKAGWRDKSPPVRHLADIPVRQPLPIQLFDRQVIRNPFHATSLRCSTPAILSCWRGLPSREHKSGHWERDREGDIKCRRCPSGSMFNHKDISPFPARNNLPVGIIMRFDDLKERLDHHNRHLIVVVSLAGIRCAAIIVEIRGRIHLFDQRGLTIAITCRGDAEYKMRSSSLTKSRVGARSTRSVYFLRDTRLEGFLVRIICDGYLFQETPQTDSAIKVTLNCEG